VQGGESSAIFLCCKINQFILLGDPTLFLALINIALLVWLCISRYLGSADTSYVDPW